MNSRLRIFRIEDFLEYINKEKLIIPFFHKLISKETETVISYFNDLLKTGSDNRFILMDESIHNTKEIFTIIDGAKRLLSLCYLTDKNFKNKNQCKIFFDLKTGLFTSQENDKTIPPTQNILRIFNIVETKKIELESIAVTNLKKLCDFFKIELPVYIYKSEENKKIQFNKIPNHYFKPDKDITKDMYTKTCSFDMHICRKEYSPLEETDLTQIIKNKYISKTFTEKTNFKEKMHSHLLENTDVKDIETSIAFTSYEIINTIKYSYCEITSIISQLQSFIEERKEIVNNYSKVEQLLHRILNTKDKIDEDIIDEFTYKKPINTNLLYNLEKDIREVSTIFIKQGFNTFNRFFTRKLSSKGMFLGINLTIDGLPFKPGCYIDENAEGKEKDYLILHQKAHAFIAQNQKKQLNCRWIEEGLTEYLTLYYPHYNHNKNIQPNFFYYYDFLAKYTELTHDEVVQEMLHWFNADVPPSHWCKQVKSFLEEKDF